MRIRSIRSIVLFGLVFLIASCSSFSRRDSASEPAKPATPLDLPKDKNATTASPTAEPLPAPPGGESAADAGPTVTLVRKDGTVVEPTAPLSDSGVSPALMPERSKESPPPTENKQEWTYSGDNGPEHWGDLKPEYIMCRDGKMQSPIDLKWHKPIKGAPLTISYRPTKAKVVDNGHTIELDFEAGSLIKLKGHAYDLMSAHFHTPSEHNLSGKQFPIEMHLVHKDAQGKTAVIAVFFQDGADNPDIQKIWAAIPADKTSEPTEISIQPKDLLPQSNTYYKYSGSFTTPPCSEKVEWIVYNNPLHISEQQVSMFRLHYSGNARPVQPLAGRRVVNY